MASRDPGRTALHGEKEKAEEIQEDPVPLVATPTQSSLLTFLPATHSLKEQQNLPPHRTAWLPGSGRQSSPALFTPVLIPEGPQPV